MSDTGVSAAPASSEDDSFSFSHGLKALQQPENVISRTALSFANPVLGLLAGIGQFGAAAAPPGEVGPPGAEPGEAGAGPGGEAGDEDRRTPELARSVRSAGVAPTPTPSASRRLTPTPGPTVLTGPTQADLERERREESDARRRRAARRQGRESTIVTGPLGVFGPPQLLQQRAIPGVSKRLLGA